jgi:hypothetical protein
MNIFNILIENLKFNNYFNKIINKNLILLNYLKNDLFKIIFFK